MHQHQSRDRRAPTKEHQQCESGGQQQWSSLVNHEPSRLRPAVNLGDGRQSRPLESQEIPERRLEAPGQHLGRLSRSEPGEDHQVPRAIHRSNAAAETKRNPDVHLLPATRAVEAWRRNADDPHWQRGCRHHASDHVGAPFEYSRPQTITDDRDRLGTLRLVRFCEVAPADGQADDPEVA